MYMIFFFYYRLDKFSKETTVVNQIFGGFLRSQGMENLNHCQITFMYISIGRLLDREKKKLLRKFKMKENNQV